MAEIDIDAVTERVTSEQSAARKTPFDNKAAGVGKPKKFRPRGSKGAKHSMARDHREAAARGKNNQDGGKARDQGGGD